MKPGRHKHARRNSRLGVRQRHVMPCHDPRLCLAFGVLGTAPARLAQRVALLATPLSPRAVSLQPPLPEVRLHPVAKRPPAQFDGVTRAEQATGGPERGSLSPAVGVSPLSRQRKSTSLGVVGVIVVLAVLTIHSDDQQARQRQRVGRQHAVAGMEKAVASLLRRAADDARRDDGAKPGHHSAHSATSEACMPPVPPVPAAPPVWAARQPEGRPAPHSRHAGVVPTVATPSACAPATPAGAAAARAPQ